MPGKPLDPVNLQKDLRYVLYGTPLHALYYQICPPRLGLKVLEPGCGSAKFSISYALAGAEVTALDIDSGVLAYATELASLANAVTGLPLLLRIQQGSIHRLVKTFGQNHFDFVFNEGVPHHWPQTDWRRQAAINQMASVTRAGGITAIVGSNALCPDMLEYAQQVSHTYAYMPSRQEPFMPMELTRRMQRAGLVQVEVAPVEAPEWQNSRLLIGWGHKRG